jgi:plastocyanin
MIMRKLVVSLGVALVLAGGVALAQGHGSPAAAPVAATEPSAAPAPEPSPISVIHIKNFAFVPATVTIHAGQTVRFVQDDETAHTVTATDKSFDSGNLDQKATWKHTFDKEGTYTYVCTYHPSMVGKVIVK